MSTMPRAPVASDSDRAASAVYTDHGPAILNIAVEIVQAVAAQSSDQGPAEVEDQAYVGTQLSTGTSYSTGAVVTSSTLNGSASTCSARTGPATMHGQSDKRSDSGKKPPKQPAKHCLDSVNADASNGLHDKPAELPDTESVQ